MPVSGETWTIQGYTWAPKFSLLADRALQKAGFDRSRFASTLSVETVGQGMTPETEVLIIWAGQQATDRKITVGAVRQRRDAMGPKAWRTLVQWFTAVYGSWIISRATARVELHLAHLSHKEERI